MTALLKYCNEPKKAKLRGLSPSERQPLFGEGSVEISWIEGATSSA
jgi:hypothetical protein